MVKVGRQGMRVGLGQKGFSSSFWRWLCLGLLLWGAKAAEVLSLLCVCALQGGSADVAGSDWVERLGMEWLAVVGENPVQVPV